LEIIAIEDEERDRLVVIHAMRLRKQFYELLSDGAHMNYDDINVDDEVDSVVAAVERGNYRPATKRESMAVRLAALSDIVHEMQVMVQNDKELVGA